jgi:laminin gamma 1
LQAEAEALLAEHEELLGELAEQSAEVDELLKRGNEMQQVADELLADAYAANTDAEDAVKLGDQTLAEAQNTLLTLEGFDKDVQNSKDRAQEAMERMEEIVELIEEAERKTAQASSALAGAEQDAQIARDNAQEAQQEYAEQASQVSTNWALNENWIDNFIYLFACSSNFSLNLIVLSARRIHYDNNIISIIIDYYRF